MWLCENPPKTQQVNETDEVVSGLGQAAQQSADSARLDATQQAAEVARLTQLRDTAWRVLARSLFYSDMRFLFDNTVDMLDARWRVRSRACVCRQA